MIKDYVGWFWTFFQNFFFLYTGIFKSLPLQNHSIGNHPKWDLTTLGVFFLWLWRPLPVNQNIVGTKELCFISNQTLVERTKNIHRFFIRNELLKKDFIDKNQKFFLFCFICTIAAAINCKKDISSDLCSNPEMFAATHVNQQRKHFIAFCELI